MDLHVPEMHEFEISYGLRCDLVPDTGTMVSGSRTRTDSALPHGETHFCQFAMSHAVLRPPALCSTDSFGKTTGTNPDLWPEATSKPDLPSNDSASTTMKSTTGSGYQVKHPTASSHSCSGGGTEGTRRIQPRRITSLP